MAGTLAYLGGIEINVNGLYLGQDYSEFNPFTPLPPISGSVPTGSIQMFFDSADWNGISSTLLGKYSNATASLTNVTRNSEYGSLNFTTSSNLSTTASGDDTPSQATTSTIVLIYRSSGSATDHHGRMLNGANNWLFGTYGGGPGTPAAESMYAWFNNQFVIDSGSYDTNWHMMTGIRHTVNSASVYIDNIYKTGSLATGNGGFDGGLFINKGAFTPSEATQGELGVLIVYNTELSPAQITEIYNNYKTKYQL
jgi:hypothetical protein